MNQLIMLPVGLYNRTGSPLSQRDEDVLVVEDNACNVDGKSSEDERRKVMAWYLQQKSVILDAHKGMKERKLTQRKKT